MKAPLPPFEFRQPVFCEDQAASISTFDAYKNSLDSIESCLNRSLQILTEKFAQLYGNYPTPPEKYVAEEAPSGAIAAVHCKISDVRAQAERLETLADLFYKL